MLVYYDKEKLSKGGHIKTPEFGKNVWEGYAKIFNKYFNSIDNSLNEIADDIDKDRDNVVHKLGKVSEELSQFVKHAKNCIEQYAQDNKKFNKVANLMYNKEDKNLLGELRGFFSKILSKIRGVIVKIKSHDKFKRNSKVVKNVAELEKIANDTQKLSKQTKDLVEEPTINSLKGQVKNDVEEKHEDRGPRGIGKLEPHDNVVSDHSQIIQSPASQHKQEKDL